MATALTQIAYGLMGYGNTVISMMDKTEDYEPVDMVVQWGYKRPQLERFERFRELNPACRCVCVDLGWFERKDNVLFYNEKCKRIKLRNKRRNKEIQRRIVTGEPKYFLILQQITKDASLSYCPNYEQFLIETKREIEKYSDLPVVIRPHPQEKKDGRLRINATYSNRKSLEDDLRHAAGVVTWNSTACLPAIANGIPTLAPGLDEIQDTSLAGFVTQDWVMGSKGKMSNYDAEILYYLAGQQINVKKLKNIDLFKLQFQGE
jgi:capsule polysaccharide modification protein KpsS